jgi:hypothetical protein
MAETVWAAHDGVAVAVAAAVGLGVADGIADVRGDGVLATADGDAGEVTGAPQAASRAITASGIVKDAQRPRTCLTFPVVAMTGSDYARRSLSPALPLG